MDKIHLDRKSQELCLQLQFQAIRGDFAVKERNFTNQFSATFEFLDKLDDIQAHIERKEILYPIIQESTFQLVERFGLGNN